VLPLSLGDAVNHGPFHFLVDFQNAEPDPVSYPRSRVERGAERHNALMEKYSRRSSGKSRGTGVMGNRLTRRRGPPAQHLEIRTRRHLPGPPIVMPPRRSQPLDILSAREGCIRPNEKQRGVESGHSHVPRRLPDQPSISAYCFWRDARGVPSTTIRGRANCNTCRPSALME